MQSDSVSLRSLLEELDREGILVNVWKPVSCRFQIPAILKKLEPRPVLFHNIVENSGFRLVGNLCADRNIISRSLNTSVGGLRDKIIDAIENPGKIDIVENPPCQEIVIDKPDLRKLPFIWTGVYDKAPYISASIIVAYDKDYGYNASFHRLMFLDKERVVARIVPRHLYKYIERGVRDVAITIGNHPAFMLASAITTEIGRSELQIASKLAPIKYAKTLTSDLLVPAFSEVVLEGRITDEYVNEGPFIDILGTYDTVRKERIIEITCITMRRNPIFQYILPSGLEHKNLMGYPREVAIFKEVSRVCECLDVRLTPGGASWLNAVVKIRKKNEDDPRKAMEAAFKVHESLKYVIVVDEDIDIDNPLEIEWAIATRTQLDKDLVVKPGERGSSLDPSADQITRETCKAGLDATIPLNKDRSKFQKAEIPDIDLEQFLG